MRYVFTAVFILSLTMISVSAENNAEMFFFGVSKSGPLPLTSENFKKIGYTVAFPESISDNLSIKDISIGIGLSVMITEPQAEKIQQIMTDAIEDDEAFTSLSSFSPYRQTGAFYFNGDRSEIVVIATMPTKKYNIVEKGQIDPAAKSVSFKISGIDCIWMPDAESPTLSFSINRTSYMIFTVGGNPLLKDDALHYAVSVIKRNNFRN